ncbi:threonine/homoserine/homoserine lactone efflux protein [Alteromonadaceae bacterium 2753L.S.0a.02]|nr:threonine/homoserine/homoserine lactone efflux protein [Alteromonadaceae bacterium 2753L.S.0a.02]
MEFFAFIIISIGFIATPGPNVLVVISTSLNQGRLRGLQTVAGTSSAMLLQLLIAALATSSVVTWLSSGFLWLKWGGVIYLLYLGLKSLLALRKPQAPVSTAIGSFQRGFWVSLTNPKTILFFSAFLPQFVSNSAHYLQQIALLSGVFWTLALLLDSGYALLAGQLGRLLRSRYRQSVENGLSGTLYLGAASILAATPVK